MIAKLAVLLIAGALTASALDLRTATIQLRPNAPAIEKKAAQMIAEEVEKRTQLRLPTGAGAGAGPIVSITRGAGPADGYTVTSSPKGVTISGNDDRGVIFGAGFFLRQARMARQQLEIADGLAVTSAPKVAIRGHQLGYRPKTNSYDAWNVAMWEQYIRELAIFGTNTIELIPPRSDDDRDSPHFSLPPMEMMVEMSRICAEYGLDVSIWFPAMDKDYADPKTVEFALNEWGEVFRRLPRVDAVFVPGGDPGDTQPKYLMALLEKQTANLRKYHPKAQMWVSPQSFDQAWMEEFIGIVGKQPAWLAGVVFGPQVRGSIDDLRARVPKRYPIRFYPDITHSRQAEFPVPEWDFAFAATEGREGVNPRPTQEAAIFRRYVPSSVGFVTYSEGCNDDVNKFAWSGLGWDPQANVVDLLRDYSRFFMGPDNAEGFAQVLMSLERNWKGPLATNGGVETTLQQLQILEGAATPQLRANWRFQQALYRAYYDAWLRARLAIETAQQTRAMAVLGNAARTGSVRAMDEAEAVLFADALTPDARALRARVFELAEALFQSVRMQLSVARYRAIAIGRGANLDAIDFALNDRVWLRNEFSAIRSVTDEKTRLARVARIVEWTNPGPGGFYDDLGDTARQPHLVSGEPYDRDPDFLKSPLVGFGDSPDQGWRVSWFTHAETLGDTPLRLHYPDLDKGAQYAVRVVYGGDAPKIQIRLTANGAEIHGFRNRPRPVAPLEYEIPRAVTAKGELTLEWSKPAGGGGNGRGVQVSEVWLIRK
ncbi:MAG TPA: glycoside hydrolase family 20 zincin-like fold domain-containing protein [Bryobacteraceae bacterium]|nr:glycoside hydrolase family 20 zincin-like fold domain-containing protein [Bryobacteraceae bacterium]